MRNPFRRDGKKSISFDISQHDYSALEKISELKGWNLEESIKRCLISGLREKEVNHLGKASKKATSYEFSLGKHEDLRKKHALLSGQETQLNGTNGGYVKIYEEQIYNNTLLVLSLTGNKAAIRDFHRLLEIEGDGKLDKEDRYFMDTYLTKKT
ncbi:MAG: hypothetical protein ACE5KG_02820 [Nitrososphaerales archaeon]